jgi:hypothetical protein
MWGVTEVISGALIFFCYYLRFCGRLHQEREIHFIQT